MYTPACTRPASLADSMALMPHHFVPTYHVFTRILSTEEEAHMQVQSPDIEPLVISTDTPTIAIRVCVAPAPPAVPQSTPAQPTGTGTECVSSSQKESTKIDNAPKGPEDEVDADDDIPPSTAKLTATSTLGDDGANRVEPGDDEEASSAAPDTFTQIPVSLFQCDSPECSQLVIEPVVLSCGHVVSGTTIMYRYRI